MLKLPAAASMFPWAEELKYQNIDCRLGWIIRPRESGQGSENYGQSRNEYQRQPTSLQTAA